VDSVHSQTKSATLVCSMLTECTCAAGWLQSCQQCHCHLTDHLLLCFCSMHACMHACLVLGYKSKCSCMPRQELFRILTAASDARVIKHPQCSCLHRRGFKMGPVLNLRRRKAFSLQNHLCYIHVKCVFECLSTGGRTAAQVAALSSPLPHRAQRQAHNPLGQGPYRSQPTETCATPAT